MKPKYVESNVPIREEIQFLIFQSKAENFMNH